MTYAIYGPTSLYESFGDFVIYRNLIPVDPRLPAVGKLRQQLGLESSYLPRKAEPDYGRVVVEMLRHARQLTLPGGALERLVYIGDTRMNDGMAFQNLCIASGWPGWAFIGQDVLQQPLQVEIEGSFYLANRWAALPDFLRFLNSQGFALDEATAVVIDIDKTFIGAKGRNDKVIDAARVEAIKRTVADLLGSNFNEKKFLAAYNELKLPAYHPFTADNQDYLAYICLMLGAGLFELESLVLSVKTGCMRHFEDVIADVERRRSELASTGLTPVHDEVWRCVQAGDPTPFKAFRYNEYQLTAACFSGQPADSVDRLLAERIVITQEVRQAAAALQARGALLFGLSDKPDEASLPNEIQSKAGLKPLHRLTTLAVGWED